MPTLEISPTTFDQLVDKISTTPFPANAKIRITITGLAFCYLNTQESKVYFLTHVDDHLLKMAVIKRVRSSGATYPVRTYDLEKGDEIAVKVTQSQAPPQIGTPGTYPLDEMVNLNKIHGNNPIKYVGPSDEDHPHFPTRLSIKYAAFYTAFIHPRLFVFRERGTANQAQPDEIGYAIGGLIAAPAAGNTTISANDSSFSPALTLAGIEDTEEMVYDVIFDNHCDPNQSQSCNQKVKDHGGPKGTDFFNYYDVLREDGDFYRQFCLEHLIAPTAANGGEEPDTTTRGGESFDQTKPKDINPDLPGGSGDVAACNPILVDPNPIS